MRRHLWTLCAAGILVGCGTAVNYTPTNSPPRPLAPRTFAGVEVLSAGPPQRPYVEVGIIEARPESAYSTSGDGDVMNEMRMKAAEIGCDAMVVTGDTNHSAPFYGGITTVKGYRAACIVYKDAK